jgi:hypothetical protein
MGTHLQREERSDYYWPLPPTGGQLIHVNSCWSSPAVILGSESRRTLCYSLTTLESCNSVHCTTTHPVQSSKLLLAVASTVILGSEASRTTFYFLTTLESYKSVHCTATHPAQSSKLLLDLVTIVILGIGPHDHISVLSRLLRVLKRGNRFGERKGLTTAGHPRSAPR